MVTNVTSLTRSGLADFLVQRISAVVLALYTLCVFGFLLVTEENPIQSSDVPIQRSVKSVMPDL